MSHKLTLCAVSAFFLFAVDLNAKVVTQQAAESIAKDFAVSKGLSKDKLVSYRQAKFAPAFRAQSTDQPAYHIFTDTENGGFIVVSGDDIARPILGYSFNCQDNGNDVIPPAMQDWLNDMEKQILQILSSVGQRGISVQALAKHVYNMNVTFFSQPDFGKIRNYVQYYLLRNSKSETSLIERTGRRGVYRLNTARNVDAQQLMIKFSKQTTMDEELEGEITSSGQDYSLSLF